MKQNQNKSGLITTVNEIIENGRKQEILQLYTEDESYNGRTILIKGKELLNFGSCSYLGLELDERLKRAAIEAIEKYGIQYSSSRSYVSCTLYEELERLVRQIFNAHVVLTPTTTLGHQAVIPVIVNDNDLLIIDQQVHASVQYAAFNMQNKGVSVTVVRHNNLQELESLIIKHKGAYNNIWYMADGIYSMYGDYLPLPELIQLLNKYRNFHLYVDDAHGMSWTGRNGRGFVLGQTELHPKMIVGTSFAKAFGTGGGAFLFQDEQAAQRVRNCGGPLIFSGPNQIPVLAASIASAKIHLSDEINRMQEDLKEKILYCHELLTRFNLPVVSNPETPIKFIGLGLARVAYNMVKRMMNSGFYCNLAVFPAVPETCTGIRFTITAHHTREDIKKLVHFLSVNFHQALAEEGRSLSDIHRAFKKVKAFAVKEEPKTINPNTELRIQSETSIEFISQELWNKLLPDGTYDWEWLRFLEGVFTNNSKPEHNWTFHYYIVWDGDKPLLATFFTSTINKDDMLAAPHVSYQIELQRLKDPYYLCSKTFMMGSLITEGSHLYIDKSNPKWQQGLMTLVDHLWNEQVILQANSICLRDFGAGDTEVGDFLMEQGFLKTSLPDNHKIENVKWSNAAEYLDQFNARQRYQIKHYVIRHLPFFETVIIKQPTEMQIEKWYELYRNVKGKSYELNTFELPLKLFREMSKNKNCEIMQIKNKIDGMVVAVTFNLIKSNGNYCGIIIGLDYNYVKSHSVYKQTLFQALIRAGQLSANKIYLGFTASDIKRKFGALAHTSLAYVQFQDQYNLSVINSISNSKDKVFAAPEKVMS
jgi:7-keto-8-aminopelargonate synthetase-like enzyme/predicted N-acyltransferase